MLHRYFTCDKPVNASVTVTAKNGECDKVRPRMPPAPWPDRAAALGQL